MDEPQWIEHQSVLEIHQEQLSEHGGLSGVRDAGLLLSALHRPRNLWGYSRETADLAALSAAYAAGIARNHPFIDGKKRTAAVVCEAFIELNGGILDGSDDDWYSTMVQLASGGISEEELVEWIDNHLKTKS
jgi:death-on-curing protein